MTDYSAPLWRSADSPLNIADLCPAIPDMGLLYLLAYLLWVFILLRGQGRLWCSRISAKVRLGVLDESGWLSGEICVSQIW